MGTQDMSFPKCCCLVPGVKQPNKKRVCQKRATTFVRVEYAHLHAYRKGETKFDDILPVCRGCWEEKVGPDPLAALRKSFANDWRNWEERVVHGLRGQPAQYEVMPPDFMPEAVQDDRKERMMTSFKADLKRTMGQKNAQGLTPDDWRKLLLEAVDEFIVEGVIRS